MLDNLKIMRYLQSLQVNGEVEWNGVLHLFESLYRRQCKFVLRYTESGRRQVAVYWCGRFLTRRRGIFYTVHRKNQLY